MTLAEDNTWGFGQVFPLFLLILPLVSFFEAVYGEFLLLVLEPVRDWKKALILCLNIETAFTPGRKPPQSPHDSETAFLTQAPGGRSDSSYSAILRVPDECNMPLVLSGSTQPHPNLYQKPWFRRLIVLMYGLTLGLAGQTLWLFPFSGILNTVYFQHGIVQFIWVYAPWLAYNFGIVWVYILVSLYLSHTIFSKTAASSVPIGPHDRHLKRSWWTGPTASNILICVLLMSSYAIGGLKSYLWFGQPLDM